MMSQRSLPQVSRMFLVQLVTVLPEHTYWLVYKWNYASAYLVYFVDLWLKEKDNKGKRMRENTAEAAAISYPIDQSASAEYLFREKYHSCLSIVLFVDLWLKERKRNKGKRERERERIQHPSSIGYSWTSIIFVLYLQ